MRRFLDGIYRTSQALACASLAIIASLVVVQIVANLTDKLLRMAGLPVMGFIIPSLTDMGVFLLAAATSLALGPALKSGTHVRVSILIENVGPGVKRVLNAIVLVIGLAIVAFCAFYLVEHSIDAFKFDEKSPGLIAFPLWVPQTFLAAGFIVFAIAMLDELVLTLRTGEPGFERAATSPSEGE